MSHIGFPHRREAYIMTLGVKESQRRRHLGNRALRECLELVAARVPFYVASKADMAGQRGPRGYWPRLPAPRCCPGHPMALVKPARRHSGRTLLGLVFHTGALRRRHASRQVGQPGRNSMWKPAAQRLRETSCPEASAICPPASPASVRLSSGQPPASASLQPRPHGRYVPAGWP